MWLERLGNMKMKCNVDCGIEKGSNDQADEILMSPVGNKYCSNGFLSVNNYIRVSHQWYYIVVFKYLHYLYNSGHRELDVKFSCSISSFWGQKGRKI